MTSATGEHVARPPVEVVRALWLAHRHGRIAEMLAYVHPDVVWHPMTRPGPSRYDGHDGLLRMLTTAWQVYGEFRMDFDEMRQLDDGRVCARGRIVRLTDDGDETGPELEAFFSFQDGLVVRMESRATRV